MAPASGVGPLVLRPVYCRRQVACSPLILMTLVSLAGLTAWYCTAVEVERVCPLVVCNEIDQLCETISEEKGFNRSNLRGRVMVTGLANHRWLYLVIQVRRGDNGTRPGIIKYLWKLTDDLLPLYLAFVSVSNAFVSSLAPD